MREIKFRIWDKNLKKMCYTFPYILGENGELFEIPQLDVYIIQQFTGLKDRNDKDIYEGDILYREGEASPTIGKVLFMNGEFKSIYCDGAIGSLYSDISHWYKNNIIIIGNIYENPELLRSFK